jgi:DNA-binding NtrC family response regulator
MLDVLLVDDERSIRLSVGDAMRAAGHRLTVAADGAEALALVESQVFDVVVSDIRLPKVDGLTVFRRVRQLSPTTDVILITAYGAVTDAVSALKEGAQDYLLKPFETEEILVRLERIAERRNLRKELEAARTELAARVEGPSLIGSSPLMARLRERIETIAGSDAPVLITGETGSGKELVARSLYELSPRRGKPFVAVNCAAFPETLLEAELFGHERGAFTGAMRRREGRFQAANGGVLFLDEIGEIPPTSQAKLLRVLESGRVEPLGTNTAVALDVRLLSATNRNLRERIAEGRFREDLYYRLNVLDVTIPPLRERRADLPLLVEHFLRRYTPRGDARPSLSPQTWAVFSEYAFPGNVRELEHAVERAVVLARGSEIQLEHLPNDMVKTLPALEGTPNGIRPLAAAMRDFERAYLLQALAAADGKKARAAAILGISRKSLWEKLRGSGLDAGSEPDE